MSQVKQETLKNLARHKFYCNPYVNSETIYPMNPLGESVPRIKRNPFSSSVPDIYKHPFSISAPTERNNPPSSLTYQYESGIPDNRDAAF